MVKKIKEDTKHDVGKLHVLIKRMLFFQIALFVIILILIIVLITSGSSQLPGTTVELTNTTVVTVVQNVSAI